MNIRILDHYASKEYVNWDRDFTGLTFTSEMPGGMISASFDVPLEYYLPYQWADVMNRVSIHNGPTEVWSGFIWGLERYWGAESGIRVDCVGNVAWMNMILLATNLSNEKASTYITDHIAAQSVFQTFVPGSSIDTTDYTIPGTREYKPLRFIREVMDDIYSFNQDTHDWYVWNDTLYWKPKETEVAYETSTENCTGSLRQTLDDFSNYLGYSYRDADGLITTGLEYDPETSYPWKAVAEDYSENMTAAQAETIAEASLENRKVLGATAEIEVSRVWRLGGGEVPVSEVRPGKLIHISGLVAAKSSPSQVFVDNDIDTFVIKSVTYNHDSQSISIGPGRLPHTLPKALASK